MIKVPRVNISIIKRYFMVDCRDGSMQRAEAVELPFYNKAGEIPRGKREDITQRA